MRAGWVIGLPITILQYGIHSHTGAVVDPFTVVNNFAVCNAVYDADRITGPAFASERLPTRLSALVSSCYYASDVNTQPLVPFMIALHTSYKDLKPIIGPVKPFLVSLFWTLQVYYVPLLRSSGDLHTDVFSAASLFLSVAALSHAVDILDTEEDAADGVLTPAVVMGKEQAKSYAFAMLFASAWLHTKGITSFPLYDIISLCSLIGIVEPQLMGLTVVLSVLFSAGYVYENEEVILAGLLKSTEVSHRVAIDMTTDFMVYAKQLPSPWKECVVNLVFGISDVGDTFGHQLLDVYEKVVRMNL